MTKEEFTLALTKCFQDNDLTDYATEKNIAVFYELTNYMLESNKKMNLTALRDEHSVITRHIADCLLAAKFLPEAKESVRYTLLDVGSGGGMPALPFAIVRPDIHVVALDATAKKTAYIKAAAEHLGLSNVDILTGRAEELARDSKYREKFDIVTARAVAELRILMEWCIPFLKNKGMFLALKGKNGDVELKNAKMAIHKLSCTLLLDDLCTLIEGDGMENSSRHNFLFKKDAVTNALYPRRNAQITKNPL